MFGITNGKGFHMCFANGWTVSVQFGPGSYCGNRDGEYIKPMNINGESYWPNNTSLDAEIAAWDRNGNWYVFEDYGDGFEEKVKGWVTPDGVLAFMNEIASKEAHHDKD